MNIDDQQLSYLWRAINARWHNRVDALLTRNNLSHTDRMVLLTMATLKLPTKSDLAQVINVRPQSLTRSIERLLQRNYLTKITNKDDKRFVRLKLTANSRTIIKSLQQHNHHLWEEMLQGIPHQEINKLTRQLQTMLSNINGDAN